MLAYPDKKMQCVCVCVSISGRTSMRIHGVGDSGGDNEKLWVQRKYQDKKNYMRQYNHTVC